MSASKTDVVENRLVAMRQMLTASAVTIFGYAELLSESEDAKAQTDFAEDLRRIMTAAQNLKDMVSGLLESDAVNKIRQGTDVIEAERRLRHDLRTPINAIKGYAEMLAEDLDDDGADAVLLSDFHRIIAESDKFLADLQGVVALSRGEEGDQTGGALPTAMNLDYLAASDASKAPMRSGRVLVVDDVEANRDLLARRLSGDGHEVIQAEGGVSALSILELTEVDVVLLDLMMPDMNGLEVLQRIRASDKLRHIPVIMISALDEMQSAIRCIEAGAEDYLSKPVNATLLRARLNACLERREWRAREMAFLRQLEEEKDKSDKLLRNILPVPVIERINAGEEIIADRFEEVSVIISDIVGFTALSTQVPPHQMVARLNDLFSEFDELTLKFGVEKIKTIGDAYMAVCGLPEANPDHASAVAQLALAMRAAAERQNRVLAPHLRLRIGIHSGVVIAGVIGKHKFVYDIWGDTVNIASRMEANSLTDHIQMTGAVARRLDDRFQFESRGRIAIKGIGRLETFFLEGFAG